MAHKDVILVQNDDMRVLVYKDNSNVIKVNIVRGSEDMTMPIKDLGRLIETMKAAHSLAVLRSIY